MALACSVAHAAPKPIYAPVTCSVPVYLDAPLVLSASVALAAHVAFAAFISLAAPVALYVTHILEKLLFTLFISFSKAKRISKKIY